MSTKQPVNLNLDFFNENCIYVYSFIIGIRYSGKNVSYEII